MSSCYETKINKEAIVYEKGTQTNITINANTTNLSTMVHFFGENGTEDSSLASNTQPVNINLNSCIKHFSINITTPVSGGTTEQVFININESSNSDSEITGITGQSGLYEKSLIIPVGSLDRIRLELRETFAMTGNFAATAIITLGACE